MLKRLVDPLFDSIFLIYLFIPTKSYHFTKLTFNDEKVANKTNVMPIIVPTVKNV